MVVKIAFNELTSKLTSVTDLVELLKTDDSFLKIGPVLKIPSRIQLLSLSSHQPDETLLPPRQQIATYESDFYIANLKNVLVTARSTLIHGGEILRESYGANYAFSSALRAGSYYQLDNESIKKNVSQYKVVDKLHYFVSNEPNDRNIFHFFHIALPRLNPLIHFGLDGIPLFSSYPLTYFQRCILSTIGNERIIACGDSKSNYLFRNLILPVIGQPYLTYAPNRSIHLYLKHRLKSFSEIKSATTRRIYISRKDASVRRVLNESDLETVLTHRGFQSVIMSELDPLTQISLFLRSTHSIFPHGAGGSFIGLQEAKSKSIELSPIASFGPHFNLVSNVSEMQFKHFHGGVKSHGQDLIIDIEQFESFLDETI